MSAHSSDRGGPEAMNRSAAESEEYVTFMISGQLFGIPVLKVQDVLSARRINHIPLAPPEVAGLLNLRGRIVTAIDVRCRLALPISKADDSNMSIVAENNGELYSLMVDSVGEVLTLSRADYERNPPTMPAELREFADGVYRLQDELLVVLNVQRLLNYGRDEAA